MLVRQLSVLFTFLAASSACVLLDEDFCFDSLPDEDGVQITVTARTTGYMGIGFSLNGKLDGADLILLWVDDETNKPRLIDSHGVKGKQTPVEDAIINYEVIYGSQNLTHTTIRFSRKYDTCDRKGDVVIVNDTMRVIWAVSKTDPGRIGFEGIRWRGPQSFHIALPPLTKKPETKIFWDVLAQDFTLPDHSYSFYWCKIYKIPSLDSKHHIVGFQPMIQNGHESLVEHMVFYECLGGNEFEIYGSHPGAPCRDSTTPPDWSSCYTPIISWATGSRGEFLPDHIGLPMAEGEGKATYFMLEIHYDNPAMQRVKDNSGLRIYYTPELRQFDSSILITGVAPTALQLIPPKQKKFTNTGYCDNQCTNLMFPENGIKIVSVVFHTHSAGRQVRVRHIRDGREVGIIAEDKNYDPQFQQSKRLSKEVIVMPGDDIITECTYDTEKKTKLTLGGYSINDETCLAYLLYYPRTALASCTSMTPVKFFFDTFGIQEFYENNMTEMENLILIDSEKRMMKTRPQVPMKSLIFRFSEKNGFNIETNKPPNAILKAMAEFDLEDDSIFSRLMIYLPEEFQNKTVLDHLKDLPWHEKLFTQRVEEILNRGRHQTYCRLQNSIPAMPVTIYNYPNFTEAQAEKLQYTCRRERTGGNNRSLKYLGSPLLVFILAVLIL